MEGFFFTWEEGDGGLRGGEGGGEGEGDLGGRASDIFEDELSGGGGGEGKRLGEGLEDGAYGWSGEGNGEGESVGFGDDCGIESGEIGGVSLDGDAEGLGRGNEDFGGEE